MKVAVYIFIPLVLFLFGCRSTKRITETDREAQSVATVDIAVSGDNSKTETAFTVQSEKTATDETVTETFFSQPDSAGTTHIIKTVETRRVVRQVAQRETEAGKKVVQAVKETATATVKNDIKENVKEINRRKMGAWIYIIGIEMMTVLAVLVYIKRKKRC